MTIADAAVEAAARYVSRSIYGQEDGPDDEDLRHGRELVLVIAPHILTAERARVASLREAGTDALAAVAGEDFAPTGRL